MARNAEKAMTALARWRRMKEEEAKGPVLRRPNNPRSCSDLKQAEKWRREYISEVAKMIASIQNPGLGEYKIRDLNDEINKSLRQKMLWEMRIKDLGGPDYKKTAPRMLDREGREVPGNRGYKYFGAAKDLPGVRDLFEQPAPMQKRKTRAEMMRDIDADYYGYMDDDDGLLIPLEREQEKRAQTQAVDEWRRLKEEGGLREARAIDDEERDIYYVEEDEEEVETDNAAGPSAKGTTVDDKGQPTYIAHVPVPSQKEIEEALLRRKKLELLEKYASEALREQSKEAQTLMGFVSEAQTTQHVAQVTPGAQMTPSAQVTDTNVAVGTDRSVDQVADADVSQKTGAEVTSVPQVTDSDTGGPEVTPVPQVTDSDTGGAEVTDMDVNEPTPAESGVSSEVTSVPKDAESTEMEADKAQK